MKEVPMLKRQRQMRIPMQKIRGYNRRIKQIEQWKQRCLHLDVNSLQEQERNYVKIAIHPWNGLSFKRSMFPEPTGIVKQNILSGLLDIYESWKTQLEALHQPYYLKLWLYEPRFSQSQVVCAVGNGLHWYDQTFFKSDETQTIDLTRYGVLRERLQRYSWSLHLDEDNYDIDDLEEPAVRSVLAKPHRIETNADSNSGKMVFVKRGSVWLGER
jgi:hypothetical protein